MQTERGRVLQFGLLYGLIASGQLTFVVSHAVTCQLRYAARSDQGECLNDYKPGLQDRGACGQFGGPGGGDVFTN